jgi:hypothetical protein
VPINEPNPSSFQSPSDSPVGLRGPPFTKALAELLIFSAPSFQAKRLEDDTAQIV